MAGSTEQVSCGRKIGEFDCCSVVEGDCLELMRELPDGCVDAVITDPPYGIGFKYDIHCDTAEGYGAWLWSVMEQAERCAIDGAPLFVWQAAPNIAQFASWFPRKWRLFIAAKNFVQIRPSAMQWAFDPVVVWWKGDVRGYSDGNGTRDWFIADTASVVCNASNLEKGHPCPRPCDQIEHVISRWVSPCGLLLDPFLGSGTSAISAIKLGRHFLGFEISAEYCAIARARIAAVEAQPTLFQSPAEQLLLETVR